MPAVSEEVYQTGAKEDPEGAISWLSEKLAALTTEESAVSDKWKITKFQKTPPVCWVVLLVLHQTDVFSVPSLDVNVYCCLC